VKFRIEYTKDNNAKPAMLIKTFAWIRFGRNSPRSRHQFIGSLYIYVCTMKLRNINQSRMRFTYILVLLND